jgi:hypothetical protein
VGPGAEVAQTHALPKRRETRPAPLSVITRSTRMPSFLNQRSARTRKPVSGAFRRPGLDEGEPGRIVDCDVHEFPTCGFALAAADRRGRADAPEARELPGIEVNKLARAGAAVAPRRLVRRQRAPQVDDHDHPRRRQLFGDEVRPRAALLQAGSAFAAETGEPLVDGAC